MAPYTCAHTGGNLIRPLGESGSVTFPRQGNGHTSANAPGCRAFWNLRCVKAQEHRAYLVTRFAPDEFDEDEFLNSPFSKPLITNGLDARTKKPRDRVFQVLWAFHDSGDAAVFAAKRSLLANLDGVQPEVLQTGINHQQPGMETYGRRGWAAEVDVPVMDEKTGVQKGTDLVRLEVLDCPIWMRHPDDEVPFLLGYVSPEGELAELFAITVNVMLREENAVDIENEWNPRNRWQQYVHVCNDREIALAAWIEEIWMHGDRFFKPHGDMQLPGGQSVGEWPPKGRLDLYWEGKTIDYEAIFVSITSMCFESANMDASEALVKSAIDDLQQKRDGYVGLGPNLDLALRALKRVMKEAPKARQRRPAQAPISQTRSTLAPRPAPPPKLIPSSIKAPLATRGRVTLSRRQGTSKGKQTKDKKAEKDVDDSESSLSSVDESPERPDWSDGEEKSSDPDDVIVVQALEEGDEVDEEEEQREGKRLKTNNKLEKRNKTEKENKPEQEDKLGVKDKLGVEDKLEAEDKLGDEDTMELDNRMQQEDEEDTPLIVKDAALARTRSGSTPLTTHRRQQSPITRRETRAQTQQPHAGADRRRRIAQMNPEMKQYAKGI